VLVSITDNLQEEISLLSNEKYQNVGVSMVICVFCKKEYDENQVIIEKRQTGLKEIHYVYSCPNCGQELSVSH